MYNDPMQITVKNATKDFLLIINFSVLNATGLVPLELSMRLNAHHVRQIWKWLMMIEYDFMKRYFL